MKGLAKLGKTSRGFELIEFLDMYGVPSSLQMSSLAKYEQPGVSAVWLGCNKERMHLDRKQVASLIAHLAGWLNAGSFKIGLVDGQPHQQLREELRHARAAYKRMLRYARTLELDLAAAQKKTKKTGGKNERQTQVAAR